MDKYIWKISLHNSLPTIKKKNHKRNRKYDSLDSNTPLRGTPTMRGWKDDLQGGTEARGIPR